MNDDFDWTPEVIERLKQLWKDGISMAQIGLRLGVSKNAVCGKVHRLKLESRANPCPTRSYGQSPGKPAPPKREPRPIDPHSSLAVVPLPAPRTAPVAVRLTSSTRTCQWLEGHPRELRWCGEPVTFGRDCMPTSWCARHHAMVFVRPGRVAQVEAAA